MKTRIYLRISNYKGRVKCEASTKPNYESLWSGSYPKKQYIPTVMVCLELDIADKEFEATRALLKAKIDSAVPAIDMYEEGELKK